MLVDAPLLTSCGSQLEFENLCGIYSRDTLAGAAQEQRRKISQRKSTTTNCDEKCCSTSSAFAGECHFTVVVDYRYLVYVIFFSTIVVPSVVIVSFLEIFLRQKFLGVLLRLDLLAHPARGIADKMSPATIRAREAHERPAEVDSHSAHSGLYLRRVLVGHFCASRVFFRHFLNFETHRCSFAL